jgi:hypothetical protein
VRRLGLSRDRRQERQRLLDKISRLFDNLRPADGEATGATDGRENYSDEIPV